MSTAGPAKDATEWKFREKCDFLLGQIVHDVLLTAIQYEEEFNQISHRNRKLAYSDQGQDRSCPRHEHLRSGGDGPDGWDQQQLHDPISSGTERRQHFMVS